MSIYTELLEGLENHEKLPEGDPRGIIYYHDYPPELQRAMDSTLYND